jgi:tripartite-type tricarboxylate transporter receptor subunit TctC
MAAVARTTPFLTAIAAALVAIGPALAQSRTDPQNYPARPVRIVLPNTAGSAMDMVTRMMSQRFTEAWGQQVVVDNRPGAGGIIGLEIAAKAPPDGYTIVFSSSAGLVIQPLLMKVPYDTQRDFTPISLVVISPQMLVSSPTVPAKTVDELVALARAKPRQLHCASPGTGTSNHLGCEMLKVMGGVDIVHVPYKGTSPAITDVMGGQVQFMFNSMPAVWPLAKAGKLRAIAHGGTKRSPAAPDVPTVSETLPGFQCQTWYALLAPRGIPAPILNKLNAETVKMLNDPAFAKRLSDQGQDPQASSPPELTAYMRSETERFARVIKAAAVTLTQ